MPQMQHILNQLKLLKSYIMTCAAFIMIKKREASIYMVSNKARVGINITPYILAGNTHNIKRNKLKLNKVPNNIMIPYNFLLRYIFISSAIQYCIERVYIYVPNTIIT